MKINENELISALGDIRPELVEEASAPPRRRSRWLIAAACLMLAFVLGMTALGAGRAAVIESKPMLLTVDGKLYKRTTDMFTLLLGKLPVSCNKNSSAEQPEQLEQAQIARVEKTELPEPGDAADTADGHVVNFIYAPGEADVKNPEAGENAEFTAYVIDELAGVLVIAGNSDAEMDFSTLFIVTQSKEGNISFSYEMQIDPPGQYVYVEDDEKLYQGAYYSDILPSIDYRDAITVWGGGSTRSGEFARSVLSNVTMAKSISRKDFIDKCAEASPETDPIRQPYEFFIIRDSRGTAISFNYYMEVGCISVDDSFWFELNRAADELLSSMIDNK